MNRSRYVVRGLLVLLAIVIVAPLLILAWQWRSEPDSDVRGAAINTQAEREQQVARGGYLARAGDCMACHTARGGAMLAGGRTIPTPFGDMVSPNITPDRKTGIGDWSADDFWRALHNGKGRDGRFLYPVFPYQNYTRISRADSDAMYAWFQTVPAVSQPNQPHALRFPYNQRLLLAGWRALYFRPGVFEPVAGQSAEWNRGAWLVQGPGHCNACHTARNALGATDTGADLAGGMIPIVNWYAPSLTSDAESGIGGWTVPELAQWLKTGVSERGAVFGPMSEVVRESLQYLSDSDIRAMSVYLKSLPQSGAPTSNTDADAATGSAGQALGQQGAVLYHKQCAACHGAQGEGAGLAYPPLAGNRALTSASAINPIRMVLHGGYPPSTFGNPRPYGMPPFGPGMSDTEVAAVVSFMRSAWGNHADAVSPAEVQRYRTVPLD
ncbi:MAG: alcohol dehydrogenase [Herminiimonas sp.]|nr:alcohol dehydrogenase [Herminiimonas sp.]